MNVTILRRERTWALIAKPARLACHRSELVRDRHTVARTLRMRFDHVHLVHRLDRGASGCLLVAFDPKTTGRLAKALRHANKTYIAWVRGYFRWDDPVVVDTPMKNTDGLRQPARSVITMLGRSHDPRCSLVAVQPTTGRYHQVRRHVRDCGHPILRDAQHGDSKENVRWRERGLQRLALHCLALDVHTPDGPVELVCPPPADLVALWRGMPWWDDAIRREPRLALTPLELDAGVHGRGAATFHRP